MAAAAAETETATAGVRLEKDAEKLVAGSEKCLTRKKTERDKRDRAVILTKAGDFASEK